MSQELTDAAKRSMFEAGAFCIGLAESMKLGIPACGESIAELRRIGDMLASNADRLERPGVLKRFWLFAFDSYYPAGGLGDMVGEYDTLEEAVKVGREKGRDHWEVLDMNSNTIIDDHDKHPVTPQCDPLADPAKH